MIIVAALIAVVQVVAQRNGVVSPISSVGTSLLSLGQSATQAVVSGVGNGVSTVLSLPHLAGDNHALAARNDALAAQNAQLQEQLSGYRQLAALQPLVAQDPKGVMARVIGFPPEDESRTVTIDRGSNAGVHKDDGVLAAGGVVGIVQEADPLSSKVVLITDYTSRLPAVVRRGRSWGIVRGNVTSVRMEYIAQDAPLKIGDTIVTGEGRTFHSGAVVGTVTAIERDDASLYQTAIVRPAVDLGALDRVVVVPH